MHELGYDAFSIPRLTLPEIRRLLEGQRVDSEIENKLRKAAEVGGDAMGKVVPRNSDRQLLQDYADMMEN